MTQLDKVLIYRLETKSGKGPYRSNIRIEDHCPGFGYDPFHHPTPSNDKSFNKVYDGFCFNRGYERYLFGFESITHFLNWFDHDRTLNWLKKMEFRVSVYSVEKKKVVFGQKQLVFCPKSANLVDILLISDVRNMGDL